MDVMAIGWLLEGSQNAVTSTFISWIRQGRQPSGRQGIERREYVFPGRSEVVDRSGFDIRYPDRETIRAHERLYVPTEVMGLPGIPRVDVLALLTDGLLGATVAVDDLAVEDEMGPVLGLHAVECLAEVWGLVGEDGQDLVVVAVRGGSAEAEARAELGNVDTPITEPDQPEHGLSPWSEDSCAFAGSQGSTVGAEQSGKVGDQFPWDIECGTIRNHVGSLGYGFLMVRSPYLGTPHPYQERP